MRRTSILVGNYINQGSMNALKWVSLKKVEILQSSEWTYAVISIFCVAEDFVLPFQRASFTRCFTLEFFPWL